MKSLLHSLDGSEAVLLMYLFDELPDEDRAEVESMLRTDVALRAQFQVLQATHDQTARLLSEADADADRRSRSVKMAQLNAVRLMGRWHTRKVIERPVPTPVGAVRKWVIYPSAGLAAALMLGLILWGLFGPTPRIAGPGVPSEDQSQLMAELQQSFDADSIVTPEDHDIDPVGEEILVRSLDTSDELIRDAQVYRHLNEAERQIAAIDRLTEESFR